ncbi:MAG: hypothetical protein J6A56_01665 [Clostridia bacterium]|nr:hypothetical protein [Clostridia bacterium]
MLKALGKLIAVSGREDVFREFLKKELLPYCDTIKTDNMGNLHVYCRGDGPEILITTYMDEPGIIITQITEDGYLRFEPVGRIRPSYLVSKRVCFGNRFGIISLKAIHLTTKKEREIPVKASQLFIDIGASSKEEAEKIVNVGDYGVLDIPFVELPNGFIKSRAIAGRMGCAAAIEGIKQAKNRNIHVVFAVQREINNRGILACSSSCDADLAIVFDGIDAKTYANTDTVLVEAGKGVTVLTHHSCGVIDSTLYTHCQRIAADIGLPIQYGVSKQQGAETNLAKLGQHQILCLSIPVRYADSTAPIANSRDMESMVRLTCHMIETICQGGRSI